MVFNATSNNISVISWRSFLLVEETGVPGENHRPVVWSAPRHERVSNSQLQWWQALIALVVVNLTTIWSRPRRPRNASQEKQLLQNKKNIKLSLQPDTQWSNINLMWSIILFFCNVLALLVGCMLCVEGLIALIVLYCNCYFKQYFNNIAAVSFITTCYWEPYHIKG